MSTHPAKQNNCALSGFLAGGLGGVFSLANREVPMRTSLLILGIVIGAAASRHQCKRPELSVVRVLRWR